MKKKFIITLILATVLLLLYFFMYSDWYKSIVVGSNYLIEEKRESKEIEKKELSIIPELALETKKYQVFIPDGWRLFSVAEGDLNKDNQSDAVLVIQKTDEKLLKENDSLGAKLLNINPRKLVILFQKNGVYSTVLVNENIIPAASLEDDPCTEDQFRKIDIKNENLDITYGFWTSCGSWVSSNNVFTFNYQTDRFLLIKNKYYSFARNTGDETDGVFDYVTGEFSSTVSTDSESNREERIVKKEVKTVQTKVLKDLSTLTFEQLYFDDIVFE